MDGAGVAGIGCYEILIAADSKDDLVVCPMMIIKIQPSEDNYRMKD